MHEVVDCLTEFVGLFHVGKVSSTGQLYQFRIRDRRRQLFGVGRRSDSVFFSDEDQRLDIDVHQKVRLVRTNRHPACGTGDSLGGGAQNHVARLRDDLWLVRHGSHGPTYVRESARAGYAVAFDRLCELLAALRRLLGVTLVSGVQ